MGDGDDYDSDVDPESIICPHCGRVHHASGNPLYGKDSRPLFATISGCGWGTEADPAPQKPQQPSPYSEPYNPPT